MKELLLSTDTDKIVKISKRECMKLMEAELDKLDKDDKGEIAERIAAINVFVQRVHSQF